MKVYDLIKSDIIKAMKFISFMLVVGWASYSVSFTILYGVFLFVNTDVLPDIDPFFMFITVSTTIITLTIAIMKWTESIIERSKK